MLLKREQLVKDILSFFTHFYVYIELNKGLNFQDVNIVLEDIFKPVFEVLYGCSFINLNLSEVRNFPAIDLGANNGELCIQITSNISRFKIKDTISKFERHELFKSYKNMQIFLLSFKKKGKFKPVNINNKYKFSSKKDIFTLRGLHNKIGELDLEKLKTIHKILLDNITPLSESFPKYSYEGIIFRDLFSIIGEEVDAVLNYPKRKVDELDLKKKKKRFSNYWSFIEDCYKKVFNSEREKEYLNVASTFSEDKLRVMSEYLQFESTKCLYLSKDDPVKAIDLLVKQMVKNFQLDFFPETQIKYFLYYQLYFCDIFPN